MKKKILFVVPHRINRSPGQRFRFEQYIAALKNDEFEITYSNIISEKDDAIFYSKGKYLQKFIIVIKSILKRLKDIRRASGYDIVFIYREAFMMGSTFFEKRLKKKAKLIFDFDDAIWLNDVSQGNHNLKWLKKPEKTDKIIKLADMVFAGNEYLANYASKFNNNVKVVPTTIDTSYHLAKEQPEKDYICIGWTGTSTTLKHFETSIPFLKEIKKKYNSRVKFKVIVNFPFQVKELDLIADQWKLETEIEDLSKIDIGIMPLPDDKWAKGKCGFKGLQYMSLEIPTIMSPVGVNRDIINDGVNGYLANNNKEWVEKISALIDSAELRNEIGKNGRKTIEESYSVNSLSPKYLNYFNDIID